MIQYAYKHTHIYRHTHKCMYVYYYILMIILYAFRNDKIHYREVIYYLLLLIDYYLCIPLYKGISTVKLHSKRKLI